MAEREFSVDLLLHMTVPGVCVLADMRGDGPARRL
jgi:hypothetical protein